MSRLLLAMLVTALLSACGGKDGASTHASGPSKPDSNGSQLPVPVSALVAYPACGTYPDGSPGFLACEASNFAKVGEAPLEQTSSSTFMQRLLAQSQANTLDYLMRVQADPSFGPASTSGIAGNTPLTPLCATWALPCVGDPFRYPGVDAFYEREAKVEPVVFYDRGCARISGRVWRPLNVARPLPAVVMQNGSVQAPEPLYWWMAQALVRAGYVVMTFDPRGQGRSDLQTPTGVQGSNANPVIFWEGLVDAIDFFRSTPEHLYPHNRTCRGTYPTVVAAFNPQHAEQDRSRLGLVGHSLGAVGVSVVQGYGAPGADPWPGQLDKSNPVNVVVAWDGPAAPDGPAAAGATGNIPGLGNDLVIRDVPRFGIRVPMMGQDGEYGLAPTPFLSTPPRDGRLGPYQAWQSAGMPVFEFTIRGSSHYEWSLLPDFPASSWCPEIKDGQCVGGWGRPMAEYYTLAWLDRWLKREGESGHEDADRRLGDDRKFQERFSFYYRSARDFPDREGVRQRCDDLRGGCRH